MVNFLVICLFCIIAILGFVLGYSLAESRICSVMAIMWEEIPSKKECSSIDFMNGVRYVCNKLKEVII